MLQNSCNIFRTRSNSICHRRAKRRSNTGGASTNQCSRQQKKKRFVKQQRNDNSIIITTTCLASTSSSDIDMSQYLYQQSVYQIFNEAANIIQELYKFRQTGNLLQTKLRQAYEKKKGNNEYIAENGNNSNTQSKIITMYGSEFRNFNMKQYNQSKPTFKQLFFCQFSCSLLCFATSC